ncbi:MAG: CapA family protein [Oscillospiraceae bacterium]|nr:CapA family protein [Oscillospiraceae bacterium]
MPNSNYNLEEQLRQDRREDNARRRKRRFHRFFPLLLILLLFAAAIFLFLFGKDEPAPAATTEAPAPGSSVATLNFVGDISLDESMIDCFRTESGFDFTPLFRRIVPRLAPADLTVGNLEGNITGSNGVSDYNYPPALLQALYDAGFDILETANSFTIQNGITGLTATKQAIQAAGMDALGTWSSQEDRKENGVLIRDVNGIRIAFLSFTKGMNNLRLPEGAEYCVNLLYSDYDTNYSKIARSAIAAAVEEARMMSPDIIIAMVHWGSEYDRQVTESQEEIAELLFDSGVHLVIGAHSHYVGPMELKNKRLTPTGGNFVAYSLGDFVSASYNASARNGCILSLTVQKDRDGTRITDLTYVPTYSAAPSESLEIRDCEVLDTLGAISFYKQGYYDRVSDKLYEQLVSALEEMKKQTGMPDNLAQK